MSTEVLKARIMTVMRNLPPMPQVTQQLLAVLRDEDASANDVTKVLSSDQALAGKVLKLVNSSFYGVPKEVTTISRAVVMLGFSGVRNLALGFGSVEALGKMADKLNLDGFWEHAMANAAAAQTLAPLVNRRTDPEEAFIAGLMHDIGAYVLAAAVPDIYAAILAEPDGDTLTLEREATGFTHPQVGQGLLQFWGLPEPFANAARYHHDITTATEGDQPLTALVALADVLACIHGGAFERPANEQDLARLTAATGVTPDQIRAALAAMDAKMGEMGSFMQIAGAGSGARNKNLDVVPMTCVVVTADEGRREWTQSLLRHFGHGIMAMESYLNQEAGWNDVACVLVDPQCLTAQQLGQLVPFLASQPVRTAVLREADTVVPPAVQDLPAMNFVFSRRDLARIMTPQTV